jgi:hypothetical protein
VMMSSTMPYSRACSAVMMKSRSVSRVTPPVHRQAAQLRFVPSGPASKRGRPLPGEERTDDARSDRALRLPAPLGHRSFRRCSKKSHHRGGIASTAPRDDAAPRAQVLRRQLDGSWLRLLDYPELVLPSD